MLKKLKLITLCFISFTLATISTFYLCKVIYSLKREPVNCSDVSRIEIGTEVFVKIDLFKYKHENSFYAISKYTDINGKEVINICQLSRITKLDLFNMPSGTFLFFPSVIIPDYYFNNGTTVITTGSDDIPLCTVTKSDSDLFVEKDYAFGPKTHTPSSPNNRP